MGNSESEDVLILSTLAWAFLGMATLGAGWTGAAMAYLIAAACSAGALGALRLFD